MSKPVRTTIGLSFNGFLELIASALGARRVTLRFGKRHFFIIAAEWEPHETGIAVEQKLKWDQR